MCLHKLSQCTGLEYKGNIGMNCIFFFKTMELTKNRELHVQMVFLSSSCFGKTEKIFSSVCK